MVKNLRAKEGSVVEIAEEASVVNTSGNLIFSVDLVGFDGKGMGGHADEEGKRLGCITDWILNKLS